jgi:putative transposase
MFRFSFMELRKYINHELKPTTHKWLGEVSAKIVTQALRDADETYGKFFKGLSNKPKFKSKHHSKPSFYVRYDSVKRFNYAFKGERLGIVRTTENLPKLKKGQKYSNPRITYDGQYWYLSVVYEKELNKQKLTNESIGIDLGIKELAVCSNGKTYKNINKTKKVKRLEKKLKREQRKLSRKRNLKKIEPKNPKSKYKVDLKECKNLQKQNKIVQKLYKKLTNIRDNHIHQATAEIVKAKPSRVVMEDLNVSGMMKNKHLSEALAQQKLYEFRRQMQYKCELNGIEFVLADRFYPSSKTCSCCGNIKKDLKLRDRNYKCEKCGLEIDRDFNASVNLANYGLTT